MPLSITLEEIIKRCSLQESSLVGDKSYRIEGVSDLASAKPNELSFFANARYAADLKQSCAGAVIVSPESMQTGDLPQGKNYIVHENPTAAFQAVLNLFHEGEVPEITGFKGVHQTAVVHPSAKIGKNVSIGPYAVVDEGVSIGDGTQILPHTYIAKNSTIGTSALIHSHVVIREGSVIGDRVIIQPGAIIGSCGFGYSTDKRGVHTKLAHWGNVVIKNDVEIGANTTIDRARFASTEVQDGTKVDNLVQIGHNVKIGRHCFVVSQVGVAGSTTINDHVVLAGKVAVNGHIEICSGAIIAACSGVTKSIKEPGKYSGLPAQKIEEHNKNAVYLRKIHSLFERVKALEEQIKSVIHPDT